MNNKCKRIIDGKTYNTETATLIEGRDEVDNAWIQGNYLYQTRFGAFFNYRYLSGADEHDHETIEPFTPDQANAWLEKNYSYQPELIEKLFGEMPEAGSGEVKYTLRMPESLRNKLSDKASTNKQSLNAWIIRCLERCATDGE
ncbi:toxin-antitoxin system HicB family antitoxin [Methylobacterium sp. CM6244]